MNTEQRLQIKYNRISLFKTNRFGTISRWHKMQRYERHGGYSKPTSPWMNVALR